MFSLDGYWTLRKHAAAVRRSDRAVISVTGRDRATWLQGLLTNDVLALQEGQSCYAAYLTPQGRMISDMQVIAGPDRIWLDVPAPLAASLRERLDGLIFAEDAQVIDESESIAVWGVYGPEWVQRFPPMRPTAATADRAEARETVRAEAGKGSKVQGFEDSSSSSDSRVQVLSEYRRPAASRARRTAAGESGDARCAANRGGCAEVSRRHDARTRFRSRRASRIARSRSRKAATSARK